MLQKAVVVFEIVLFDAYLGQHVACSGFYGLKLLVGVEDKLIHLVLGIAFGFFKHLFTNQVAHRSIGDDKHDGDQQHDPQRDFKL